MKQLNCILLVDDDEPTNYYNRRIVEKSGLVVQIDAVSSGQEALDYLSCQGNYAERGARSPHPDVIFLDINMPRMNGWEFLERYQHLPELQRSKQLVVMLTSSLNPDDQERADEMELVSDFLMKPLTAEMLEQIVARHWSAGLSGS